MGRLQSTGKRISEMAEHPNLSFRTPNATALALNSAFRSSARAALLWPQIAFDAVLVQFFAKPLQAGVTTTLWSLEDMVRIVEEWEAAEEKRGWRIARKPGTFRAGARC
jgi:hypothetical protein